MRSLRRWTIGGIICLSVIFRAYAAYADDALRATLDNGLKVVIVKSAVAPVVTTMVNYRAGANESPEGFPGTAHAEEHMMFRGSPGLSADQLSALIAAFGGEFNADTQQTVTQYFFTVPAGDLDSALRIEAIRMKSALNSPGLWQKERGAIEQEVAQDLSDPDYVLYTKVLAHIYAGTPYAHDALGTRPSFDKTTASMLKKFHRDWYGPNNAILVIVGNVDPPADLRKVKLLFGDIPQRPTPKHPPINFGSLRPLVIRMDTDRAVGQVWVVFRLPGYNSPDYAAALVLSDLLDSRRGDVFSLVAEGKALDAGFTFQALPESSLGIVTASFPKGADADALAASLKSVITGYLRNGFPADLVDAAKRHETADAEFRKNSVLGLAAAWSHALAVEGRTSPDDDIEAVNRVTKADVDRVARRYLVMDTAFVGILTPQPSASPPPRRAARGPESFSPSRIGKVSLPGWARRTSHEAEAPQWDVKPTVTALANGLTLIFVRETASDTVSVFGKVKNNADLQTPAGKEGVAELLDGLFIYGSSSLDRTSFQKALDEIAAREEAGTEFFLKVPSPGFGKGMELLADNLLRPAFREETFRVVQKETADLVKGRRGSPSYRAGRAMRKVLYPPHDPSLREATSRTVLSLKPDDVREYHRKVFRPDMTTIVIIGNITPEKAARTVEKNFGSWFAEGPRPETDLPPVPDNKPALVAVPDSSRVQPEVTLAETVGITRLQPDYYVLEVGRAVLSGAFYATRLYRDLREKTGMVYAVDAELEAGRTRSLFAVSYACDPENIGRAKAIVKRDLTDMQKEAVPADELSRARTLLIRRMSLARSSTDAVARLLLYLAVEGLPLDEPLLAAKRYQAVTSQDLKKAFARWIRPSDFVQVTLGPVSP